MVTEATKPPVFLVGAPRSGTTMLAAMLASHPAISVGPETQFFSKLPLEDLEQAARAEEWPHAATSLLMSLTLADQSVAELFETSQSEISSFLADRERSITAMLESLTLPFAAKRSKQRWAEKTPNHIQNLETIRQLWPAAPIIRIIRDARDVGLSTRKLPTFSDHVLPNIYVWQQWNGGAEDFLDNDPLSLTIRYEDLVDMPQEVLKQVCELIGEEFDPAMIEFGTAARDVSSDNEGWKKQVSASLTSSRKYAWKRDLPQEIRDVCDLVCHELLVKHGYESGPEPTRTFHAFRMSREYIEQQEGALIKAARSGRRWLPTLDTARADRIVDQPQYSRFRNPALLAKLGLGRISSLIERILA